MKKLLLVAAVVTAAFVVGAPWASADPTNLTVTALSVSPAAAVSGTTITLTSSASNSAGLQAVYYNLFDFSTGHFVCNLANVTITGSPTTYTDPGTTRTAPFVGAVGDLSAPCPSPNGITEGTYVITANYEDGNGTWVGSPDNTDLSNYPASDRVLFYYGDKPDVTSLTVDPAIAKSGTQVTLSSEANDTNGLHDVYYNLFKADGTFVCALADTDPIPGGPPLPTTYTDTQSPLTAPFTGCTTGGIADGDYKIAANWETGGTPYEGAPDFTNLSDYPASAVTDFVYDSTPPTISITTPGDGDNYTPGSTVNADFSCADVSGSGVASCMGTVANGSPIDTTPGLHTFTVNAADKAGNTASQTVNYTAAYQLGTYFSLCNSYYTGTGMYVIVPEGATCTLLPGSHVTGGVLVLGGGTLDATSVTLANVSIVNGSASICGSTITYDFRAFYFPGASGDLDIGGICGGNNIERNLEIQRDHGAVDVYDNTIGHDLYVHDNPGSVNVSDNHAGLDAICVRNPHLEGDGNSAYRHNSCPVTP